MPPTSLHWYALYPSVATFLYLKPEYTMLNSYAATVILACVLITIARLVAYLTLYPEFFTPMKEIPTPGVSSHLCLRILQFTKPFAGSELAYWEFKNILSRIPFQAHGKLDQDCKERWIDSLLYGWKPRTNHADDSRIVE